MRFLWWHLKTIIIEVEHSLFCMHGPFIVLLSIVVVNPRRACAARVTVVGLCVCLSVCLSTTILALQAMRRLMSDTNSFSATRAWKIMWRFCWNDGVREIWPICIISTGLPRPGLARSAHRGRRDYVSKSSAALNPLTITQLACER